MRIRRSRARQRNEKQKKNASARQRCEVKLVPPHPTLPHPPRTNPPHPGMYLTPAHLHPTRTQTAHPTHPARPTHLTHPAHPTHRRRRSFECACVRAQVARIQFWGVRLPTVVLHFAKPAEVGKAQASKAHARGEASLYPRSCAVNVYETCATRHPVDRSSPIAWSFPVFFMCCLSTFHFMIYPPSSFFISKSTNQTKDDNTVPDKQCIKRE